MTRRQRRLLAAAYGMVHRDVTLVELVLSGVVAEEDAERAAWSREELQRCLKRAKDPK